MDEKNFCSASCGAERLAFCRTCGCEQWINQKGRCTFCGSNPEKGMLLPYIPLASGQNEAEPGE